MKQVILLLTFGAALALAGSTAAAVSFHTSTPWATDYSIECPDGGPVDFVHVEGVINQLGTSTVNRNAVSVQNHIEIHAGGTSTLTGAHYVVTLTNNFHWEGALENGHYTYTFLANLHLVGGGAFPDYSLHQLVHLTFNANGDPVVFVDNYNTDCG